MSQTHCITWAKQTWHNNALSAYQDICMRQSTTQVHGFNTFKEHHAYLAILAWHCLQRLTGANAYLAIPAWHCLQRLTGARWTLQATCGILSMASICIRQGLCCCILRKHNEGSLATKPSHRSCSKPSLGTSPWAWASIVHIHIQLLITPHV